MDMLIAGIIINTLLFGYMGFSNEKSGVSHLMPLFLRNSVLELILTISYFGSFLIILLAPGGLIRNIIVAVLMQIIINHVIWGIITGIIAGNEAKKRL